jgi:hypothetical protein
VTSRYLLIKRFVGRSALLGNLSALEEVVGDSLKRRDNNEHTFMCCCFKNDVRDSADPFGAGNRRSAELHDLQ